MCFSEQQRQDAENAHATRPLALIEKLALDDPPVWLTRVPVDVDTPYRLYEVNHSLLSDVHSGS
jgi:hypothetical protein